MRINSDVNGSDIVKFKVELISRMRGARAAVYDLARPSWHGAFADFPIFDDEVSYTATAYWAPNNDIPDTQRSTDNADLVIATSGPNREGPLYRRHREAADSATLPVGDHTIVLTRDGTEIARGEFKQSDSARVFAELNDGSTSILVTARDRKVLPEILELFQTAEYEHLIAHWSAQ